MTEQTSTQTSGSSQIGRIKWFNNKKGFGFLSNCETQEDIFIHHTGIQLNEESLNSSVNIFKTVIEGEYVSYQTKVDNENRTVAKNVTGVFGGPLLCENVNKKIFISNRVSNRNSEEGSRHSGRQDSRATSTRQQSSETSSVAATPSADVSESDNSFASLAE